MAFSDIDFEGSSSPNAPEQTTQQNEANEIPANNQDDVTNLNGGDTPDITGTDNQERETEETKVDDNPSTGELGVGDTIDYDGVIYTVANNGDLVDDKGNVFKEAKDVDAWLKSVDVQDDDSDGMSISAIQDALGVEITDEAGNPVEFTNDAAGVKSYVDSVINLKSNEIQEATLNRFYAENPLVKQFTDYVQLTGAPRGFGEIPDRTGIRIDKDNEAQQVAIIRMAAQEFGNKSLNDNYIKYLKDSGGLYDEAQSQLKALAEKDIEYRKQIEIKAQEQRDEQARSAAEYWSNVDRLITNRVIGGHKIPESFTKEVDGKKIVLTPKDFYNYLSRPVQDNYGNQMTGYQRDLNNMTDEEYLNKEMLDAWLMFTGGTYKDLVDMAVKEDKVRQLKIRSKEHRSTKSVKVIKKNTKASIDDIIL